MSKITSQVRSTTPILMKQHIDHIDYMDSGPGGDKFLKELEKSLYKNYGNEPKKYYGMVTFLNVFLDPKSVVGQFAKFLQNKVAQGVYTPERLASLTITDALPEVFLNDKNTLSQKAEILSSLEAYLIGSTEETELNYEFVMHPMSSVSTTTSFKPPIPDIGANSMGSVRKLCSNPYWESSEADTIICKDSNKFYCLDTLELLNLIANNQPVKNPFTGNFVPDEIILNLTKRYADKIVTLATGKKVSLEHYRTDDEMQDLKGIETHFKNLEKILQDDLKNELIDIFGVEILLNEHPELKEILTDTTITRLDDIQGDKRVDALKEWVKSSLEKIKKAYKENKEHASIEKIVTEYEGLVPPIISNLVEGEEIEEGEIVDATGEKEEDEVTTAILKPGSLITSVYNEKINKIKVLQKSVIQDLEKANAENKKELGEILNKITELQNQMPVYIQSINGVVKMLQDELEYSKKMLENKKREISALSVGEIGNLTKLEAYIKDLQNEIKYLGAKKGTA